MIFDLEDNPIQSFPFSIEAEAVQILTIRVECRSGQFLRSTPADDLTVEGRKAGDAIWVNLETSAIDLSPWNAARQDFEIRLIASAVASIQKRNFKLTVGP